MIIRNEKHLKFIRQLPCCVCGSDRSDVNRVAHHLLRTGEHGMSQRSGDDKSIPLCVPHHDAQFNKSLHHDGNETEWLKRYGIPDPLELAAQLYACNQNHERGCTIIRLRLAA